MDTWQLVANTWLIARQPTRCIRFHSSPSVNGVQISNPLILFFVSSWNRCHSIHIKRRDASLPTGSLSYDPKNSSAHGPVRDLSQTRRKPRAIVTGSMLAVVHIIDMISNECQVMCNDKDCNYFAHLNTSNDGQPHFTLFHSNHEPNHNGRKWQQKKRLNNSKAQHWLFLEIHHYISFRQICLHNFGGRQTTKYHPSIHLCASTWEVQPVLFFPFLSSAPGWFSNWGKK